MNIYRAMRCRDRIAQAERTHTRLMESIELLV